MVNPMVTRGESTYTKRKRLGLCIDCSRKRGPDGTRIRCRKCADEANAEGRARYASRAAPVPPPRDPVNMIRTRLDADVCIACGAPDVGLWRCTRCDEKRSRSRAVEDVSVIG